MRIKGVVTVALTVWLVPVMSAVLGGGLAAQTPTAGPRMPLAGLEKLAAAASETVDVSLDSGLLALAARFMDSSGDDDAAVKSVLSGLKGVYVRSYEFGTDGAFGPADTAGTAEALVGLCVGLPVAVLGKILAQTLFARGRFGPQVLALLAGLGATGLTGALLLGPAGALGIGLAVSAGTLVHTLALLGFLIRDRLWQPDAPLRRYYPMAAVEVRP